jgi:A/G-specific adenine glycosylase
LVHRGRTLAVLAFIFLFFLGTSLAPSALNSLIPNNIGISFLRLAFLQLYFNTLFGKTPKKCKKGIYRIFKRINIPILHPMRNIKTMMLLDYWNRAKTIKFRSRLLGWYGKHQRSLPWRINPSPYRVWISETMLQQTQAATVVPYFNRFLKRFPNLESLAQSSEQEVLELWAGLGYYNRARNLHRAARKIVRLYGEFPEDYKTVLSLPGVGRYTAGAICSLALNQTHPVVDGNIRRVLSRLHAAKERIPESWYWDQMSSLLPDKNPSSFNQAMMELGATVCAPSQPACPHCPVRLFCRARELGLQNRIPEARSKQSTIPLRLVMLVLKKNDRILLTPLGGIHFIPGEWGLPFRIAAAGKSIESAASALCRKILGRAVPLAPCASIRHSITRYRISAFGYYGKIDFPVLRLHEGAGVRWANSALSERLITSSLFLKVLQKCAAMSSG